MIQIDLNYPDKIDFPGQQPILIPDDSPVVKKGGKENKNKNANKQQC